MPVTTPAPKSPAAILARLFETGRGEMTRQLARHILRLGFLTTKALRTQRTLNTKLPAKGICQAAGY
jgi:hypothetical protein